MELGFFATIDYYREFISSVSMPLILLCAALIGFAWFVYKKINSFGRSDIAILWFNLDPKKKLAAVLGYGVCFVVTLTGMYFDAKNTYVAELKQKSYYCFVEDKGNCQTVYAKLEKLGVEPSDDPYIDFGRY